VVRVHLSSPGVRVALYRKLLCAPVAHAIDALAGRKNETCCCRMRVARSAAASLICSGTPDGGYARARTTTFMPVNLFRRCGWRFRRCSGWADASHYQRGKRACGLSSEHTTALCCALRGDRLAVAPRALLPALAAFRHHAPCCHAAVPRCIPLAVRHQQTARVPAQRRRDERHAQVLPHHCAVPWR